MRGEPRAHRRIRSGSPRASDLVDALQNDSRVFIRPPLVRELAPRSVQMRLTVPSGSASARDLGHRLATDGTHDDVALDRRAA
jgi:hypothetical protein